MFMQTVDDNLWIFHMTIKKQIIIIWNNEQTPLFIDILSLTGQFRRNEMFIESKLRNKVKSRQGRNGIFIYIANGIKLYIYGMRYPRIKSVVTENLLLRFFQG